MRKYLEMSILICLMSGCTLNDAAEGDLCVGNKDGSYADDEYSTTIKNDKESVKKSILNDETCDGEYPICRSTSDDDAWNEGDEIKVYCAHCKKVVLNLARIQ